MIAIIGLWIPGLAPRGSRGPAAAEVLDLGLPRFTVQSEGWRRRNRTISDADVPAILDPVQGTISFGGGQLSRHL
jgi:hypothetical protein